MALWPSSPVQLVTRALRSSKFSLSAFGAPRISSMQSLSEYVCHGLRSRHPISQNAHQDHFASRPTVVHVAFWPSHQRLGRTSRPGAEVDTPSGSLKVW